MKTVTVALVIASWLALSAAVDASPGVPCQHARECGRLESCVADCPTCWTGHCAPIRVLP